ncbi:hypothetical protein [Frankia sp. AgB32]|uniref:hypothetical protein n=1 Tax=Frankia sp. AgB32 TaxID=631119 RepID=UPI00200E6FA1|nr:hypothetical protein [Frankia sp. AgB32]MCK9893889.1 hypothetical protein [Frankia sp. AgB32]
MDLTPYVENLRAELLAAADSGEARAMAERLVAAVSSASRLAMLDVLSAAAEEITRDLAPGSVELRLRGRDPSFAVTPPDLPEPADASRVAAPAAMAVGEPSSPSTDGRDGPAARINFRPPERVKLAIEAAAAAEGLSVNAWLVRVTSAALAVPDSGDGHQHGGRRDGGGRFVGWVG